jgi:hypothetical protein
MDRRLAPDPNQLLAPLRHYIVEDLSSADMAATATLAATALERLADAISAMLAAGGAPVSGVSHQFFPDPDDETTPGNLYFWPTTRTSRSSTFEDASKAEYSLRAAVFLSERDEADNVYPAGISLVLKLQESACELIKNLPPAIFERLEFELKRSGAPAGFEFLDDSQHLPAMPNLRRQFIKAIDRAHSVTTKAKRAEFESVMLHYIWDETEPEQDFGAVLWTMTALFAAIHYQAGQ